MTDRMSMEVTVHPYHLPLREPYRWAKGEQTQRAGLLVEVQQGEWTGWGEVAPPVHDPVDIDALARTTKALSDRLAAPSLEELDVLDLHPRLRAGLSTAFLDLAAQQDGHSLAHHIAPIAEGRAPRAEVPVNALVTAATPDDAARQARQALTAGFSTLKVKCTADRGADVARVAAVREVAGDQVALRLDANGAWQLSWALQHLGDLAAYGIEYVEQPVPPTELAGLARLRKASPIPIALDESATDKQAVQAIIDAHAADVLILKPQRLGGLDRTLMVAKQAHDAGLGAVMTNSLETAVGRTAALHAASLLPEPLRVCGLGTEGFLAADVAPDAPHVERGLLQVPTGPGLGIHVEVAAIAR